MVIVTVSSMLSITTSYSQTVDYTAITVLSTNANSNSKHYYYHHDNNEISYLYHYNR